MIVGLCLLIIGIVVYAMMREGVFNALCNLFGVVFAGTVSFHCYPSFANTLEDSFAGSFLANYEDAVALLGVFALVLLLFRVVTNLIANRELDIPPQISQIAGGCVGAVTGYLMAGFLVVALQTMPWEERFLGYVPPPDDEQVHYMDERAHSISNKVFPPDQVWLKMMKRANETVFEDDDRPDPEYQDGLFSEFTYKYAKYRRLGPDGVPREIPERPPPPKKKEPEKKEPEKKKKDPEKKKEKEPEKKDDRTPDLIPDPPKKEEPPEEEPKKEEPKKETPKKDP
jgi:hypothetical protein